MNQYFNVYSNTKFSYQEAEAAFLYEADHLHFYGDNLCPPWKSSHGHLVRSDFSRSTQLQIITNAI